MKKEYEKPVIELVEFEMNTAIAGCHFDVTENALDSTCIKESWKDTLVFATENSCKLEEFCYYTPEGDNSVFNS